MLIGLTGFPTAGKSAVAEILINHYNYDLLDTKEVLRNIVSEIVKCDSSFLKTQEGKEAKFKGQEHRLLMGEVGLLLEDMFGEDFLLQRAMEGVDTSRNLVVDGLRRNQALSFNGFVLEVVSTRVGKNVFSFDTYNKSKINYTINNSGSLMDLRYAVDKLMESVRQ